MTNSLPSPSISLPFVEIRDGAGYLTVNGIQVLQPLFSAVQGIGGQITPDNLLAGSFRKAGPRTSGSAVTWTPAIAGSTVAGSPTYSNQTGVFIDIGPARLALFSITLTALGSPTGSVTVAGFPIPANTASGLLQAAWLSQWGGITLSGGYTQLGAYMAAGASALSIIQSGSGNAALALPVSGLGASSALTGGVLYLR